jgi:hypothetical protein
MKQLLFFLAALAAIGPANAHRKTAFDIKGPGEQPIHWNGKPKTMTITYPLNTAGGKESLRRCMCSYNTNGDLVSSTSYANDVMIFRDEWAYIKPHQIAEKRTFDRNNNLKSRDAYQYNEKDYLIKKTTFDGAGNITEQVSYSYEEFPGHSITRHATIIESDGKTREAHTHEAYNGDGTVKYRQFGDSRYFDSKTVFTYDIKGQLIRESSGTCQTDYEYDEHGGTIKEENSGSGCMGRKSRTFRHTYDQFGNETAVFYDGDNTSAYVRQFEYY